jgi:hypothetical protein
MRQRAAVELDQIRASEIELLTTAAATVRAGASADSGAGLSVVVVSGLQHDQVVAGDLMDKSVLVGDPS